MALSARSDVQKQDTLHQSKHPTISSGFVALVPLLFTLIIITFVFRSSLLDFHPTFANAVFNDEFVYWREIHTFQEAGFNGGYHVFNEIPAAAQFTHFGAHGFVFPVLYGTLGRITGWHLYTGILYNLAFITISLGVLIYLIKPNRKQLLYLELLLLTFWPLLIFLPSLMQESIHYSLAILAAGLFFHLLRPGSQPSGFVLIACCAVLTLATLLRITWIFLFFPLVFLLSRFAPGLRGRLLRLSILAFAGMLFAVSFFVASPYPNFLHTLQFAFSADAEKGVALFITQLAMNIALINRGNLLEIAQRYQILLIGVFWLFKYRKQRLGAQNLRTVTERSEKLETWFHLLNLGPVFVVNILFYDIGFWRDYRVLSVHFLLSLLLLISFERYTFLKVTLVINLLLSPLFIVAYSVYRSPQFEQDDTIAAFEAEIQDHIVYSPSEDAWCNTVLVDTPLLYQPMITRLVALPGGIGTSYVVKPGPELPLKSKYVLLAPEPLRREAPMGVASFALPVEEADLKLLVRTSIGDLYLNQDANCILPTLQVPLGKHG